jgi:hypothetical protein
LLSEIIQAYPGDEIQEVDTSPTFMLTRQVKLELDLNNYYPLANEVAKGYNNATVCPFFRQSFRNILVNTLESTSFNRFLPILAHT